MSNIAIVVVAYNRVDTLKRLFTSLDRAVYSTVADLIISIDYSGSSDVADFARSQKWENGEKIVIEHESNMGLRDHVLKCGSYLNTFDYDAIVVLEDDLVVSPLFFEYAVQSVKQYRDCEEIAGVSLYSPLWNYNADRPFQPIPSVFDVYLMKYAQSWGQVWLKEQWNSFARWYYENEDFDFLGSNLPNNIRRWPKSSWLKYHIAYCVEKNKYFVYPFKSFSTNFSDPGTHRSRSTTTFQVPLVRHAESEIPQMLIPSFEELAGQDAVYDEYFENEKLASCLGYGKNELIVDLYGLKPLSRLSQRFVLTTTDVAGSVVRGFEMSMRPVDLNVICDVEGEDIFLIDRSDAAGGRMRKQKHLSRTRWKYDTRDQKILKNNVFDIVCGEVVSKLGRR